ncbi:alpha-1-acid glycoprotein-like [Myotis lucifugus]|uniref:alpha-1-acid glycoprotein-like n=1 Tax=Myotis lucifugus TaxID=59463 RepID=UPI000CCBECB8|nr:alpha-1-acid glycoprotein-like [Myotis lucifugus]
MALPWALAVLSLLPLLDAQSPACPNFSVPITNASLDQISGKWFYIASAYRLPEYKKEASEIHASDKPEGTPEQMQQFYDYLTCMGMDKSEVMYTDEKKNLCLPLEKQHNEERKKEEERSKTGTALD